MHQMWEVGELGRAEDAVDDARILVFTPQRDRLCGVWQ